MCATCSERDQRYRGCKKHGCPDNAAWVIEEDGVKYYDCPRHIVPRSLQAYLSAYVEHEAGHPWYGGVPATWPNRYYLAMRTIRSALGRIRAEQAKARNR